MTLLEVLTALAIFLMAMVVFGEMIVRNGQLAREVRHCQNLANATSQIQAPGSHLRCRAA